MKKSHQMKLARVTRQETRIAYDLDNDVAVLGANPAGLTNRQLRRLAIRAQRRENKQYSKLHDQKVRGEK